MSESVYSTLNKCCETLKLDFSAEEFARLAADNAFSPESLAAVNTLTAPSVSLMPLPSTATPPSYMATTATPTTTR